MKFTTLTYNLLFSNALKNIKELLAQNQPDLILLQEMATDDVHINTIKNLGYQLADFSNSFMRGKHIYGVATFYKPSVFSLKNSHIFNLPNSFYSVILFFIKNRRLPRTILKNEFVCKKTNRTLATYNIHLTPLATNSLRIKQLLNTFEDLQIAKQDAIVIAGDFNYPYGRKKFEEILSKYGLSEATNNLYHTFERKLLGRVILRLKDDYVLYKHLKLLKNEKIQINHSDHFPILTVFDL